MYFLPYPCTSQRLSGFLKVRIVSSRSWNTLHAVPELMNRPLLQTQVIGSFSHFPWSPFMCLVSTASANMSAQSALGIFRLYLWKYRPASRNLALTSCNCRSLPEACKSLPCLTSVTLTSVPLLLSTLSVHSGALLFLKHPVRLLPQGSHTWCFPPHRTFLAWIFQGLVSHFLQGFTKISPSHWGLPHAPVWITIIPAYTPYCPRLIYFPPWHLPLCVLVISFILFPPT